MYNKSWGLVYIYYSIYLCKGDVDKRERVLAFGFGIRSKRNERERERERDLRLKWTKVGERGDSFSLCSDVL